MKEHENETAQLQVPIPVAFALAIGGCPTFTFEGKAYGKTGKPIPDVARLLLAHLVVQHLEQQRGPWEIAQVVLDEMVAQRKAGKALARMSEQELQTALNAITN